MTTQVIVKSPKPNHQDVQVQVVDTATGCVHREHALGEGEEASFYVFAGQGLRVFEIPKGVVPPPAPSVDAE